MRRPDEFLRTLEVDHADLDVPPPFPAADAGPGRRAAGTKQPERRDLQSSTAARGATDPPGWSRMHPVEQTRPYGRSVVQPNPVRTWAAPGEERRAGAGGRARSPLVSSFDLRRRSDAVVRGARWGVHAPYCISRRKDGETECIQALSRTPPLLECAVIHARDVLAATAECRSWQTRQGARRS